MNEGTCAVCGYGPVPVVWGMYPSVDPEDEMPVCVVCHDGGLLDLPPGQAALGKALGRLVNALVDGEGPARRVVVQALLCGDGRPSADYDTF